MSKLTKAFSVAIVVAIAAGIYVGPTLANAIFPSSVTEAKKEINLKRSTFVDPLAASVSTGTGVEPVTKSVPDSNGSLPIQTPIAAYHNGNQEEAEQLLETTVQIMDVCGAKLSPARGAVLAQQIVRVLMDRKGTMAQREAFVSLICIESKFETAAKSTAGATGPAQVMPHLAQHFADLCGMGKLGPNDVNDPEVNLQLGSCLFFSLLEKFNGNVALALSAYNSGAESKTTKAVANLGAGHVETGWYIAKYFALQEKLRIQKETVTAAAATEDR
jgi:hypothetical protein